ncbi:DUF1330 domain-containing protein [Pseudomonas sp. NPDC089996]|uniref:DUF1330 domain-containing protein n=1 Tax=Pseudomonas sp. NPDC089996 TaxID=3364474 RepID=UPI00380BC00A
MGGTIVKGYWLILGEEITSTEAQEQYARLWRPIAEQYRAVLKPLDVSALKEAGNARRLLAVEFDSLATAHACYNDPAYAEALVYAVRASSRQLLIIEGNLA